MKLHRIFITLVSFVLVAGHILAATDSLIVETQFGPVQGIKTGSVYAFLGIPFAKPPVGELRWRPPAFPEKWSEVLEANEFPPACPQKSFKMGKPDSLAEIIGQEDCLYLNVWTPGIADSSVAVLVYIHGGGNQAGSTSKFEAGARIYDGAFLAERSKVVVVTIQYRLGALGFLVHPGLSEESEQAVSGNYGLLDQILALKWVQNNISGFGGDPNKVMLFGESGGAVDVTLLLTSPLAAGLFQRALIQSGAPVAKDFSEALNQGIEYAQKRGCADGSLQEQITCLRSLPVDSFVVDLTHPFNSGIASQTWVGNVDGWVLPMVPLEALQSGNFNQMPLIVGSNADETILTAPPGLTPELTKAFFRFSIPEQFYDRVLDLYPPGTTNWQAKESFVQATTDAQFTANARRVARAVAQNQTEPVWRYFFSHTLSGLSGLYGAYHGLELFFVFQSIESTTYARDGKMTTDDKAVTKMMREYWSRFAETGNPNGEGRVGWPVYQPTTDAYLDINASAFGGTDLRTEKCDFWDEVRSATTGIERSKTTNSISGFSLEQNFPNPFNPGTNIQFALPQPTHVTLKIIDVLGREVALLVDRKLTTGKHSVTFTAHGLPGGIYFIRLRTPEFSQTRKILYVR